MSMLLKNGKDKKKSETFNGCQRNQKHLNHDHEVRYKRLFNDYFANEPVYPNSIFHQRF